MTTKNTMARATGLHDDLLRKGEFEVRTVSIEIARRLVQRFHYARGASNTAVFLHGLFRAGEFWDESCLGVAWWIPPTRSAAEATHPDNWQGVLALSRLAIDPAVPKNAASFLISRSARLIPSRDWPCLVSYADEWRGHTGAIYRAANWSYVGLTAPEPTFTIEGKMTARKAGGKTRTKAEMLALGATDEGSHAKHKFVLLRHVLPINNATQTSSIDTPSSGHAGRINEMTASTPATPTSKTKVFIR